MASRKDDTPSVATYADHEVITPPHELRRVVSQVADDAHDDPIARAEAALEQLSTEFSGWMQAECERLEAARRDVGHLGFNEVTHGALFRAAHDIKGEAATFGYPQAAGVVESLCRLLEHTTPDMQRIPVALVDQHVDAVRAVIRETRSRRDCQRANAAAARSHGRLPEKRESSPARLSREHFLAAARSGHRLEGAACWRWRRSIKPRRDEPRYSPAPQARRRTCALPRGRLRWRNAATA